MSEWWISGLVDRWTVHSRMGAWTEGYHVHAWINGSMDCLGVCAAGCVVCSMSMPLLLIPNVHTYKGDVL